jgi:hypothetical protein
MKHKAKTYKFYADPAHGWMAVKLTELIQLGLVDQISSYSYIKGSTAYLEEDWDTYLFLSAYKAKYSTEAKSTYLHTDNRSPIRNYEKYNASKVLEFSHKL